MERTVAERSFAPLTYVEALDLAMALHQLVVEGDSLIASVRSSVAVQEEAFRKELDRYKNRRETAVADLKKKQAKERKNFDNTCEREIDSIYTEAKRVVDDANSMCRQIEIMDQNLAEHDRYYRRYRLEHSDAAEAVVNEKYERYSDALQAMDVIRRDFSDLSEIYRKRYLPLIIDAIHFHFSSTRKSDYQTLLSLKRTLRYFDEEVSKSMEDLSGQEVQRRRKEQGEQRNAMEARFVKERDDLKEQIAKESAPSTSFDANALYGNLAARLDQMVMESLPDELIDRAVHTLAAQKHLTERVNTGVSPLNGILYAHTLTYPLGQACADPALRSLVGAACGRLVQGDMVRIPVAGTARSYVPVYACAHSGDDARQMLLSTMLGHVCAISAGKLRISVCDARGRGSNMQELMGLRKRIPELFDNTILTSQRDIEQRIEELATHIEEVSQQMLGTSYTTIWDYLEAHPDASVGAELLVLFDLPSGIGERLLPVLEIIAKQGPRCGVYLMASESPDVPDNGNVRRIEEALVQLQNNCNTITCTERGLTQMGLRYDYPALPPLASIESLTLSYLLALARIRNRGIGFPAYLRRLVSCKSDAETTRVIAGIKSMIAEQNARFGRVPAEDTGFPDAVPIGFTCYPDDIFDNVPGKSQIAKAFGEDSQGINLPLMLDLTSSSNLLIEHSEADGPKVQALMHQLVWSFLSSLPVTKVRICAMDVDKKGMSFAPFLDFKKTCPDVFDGALYTDPNAVRDRLSELSSSINNTIQNKLGGRFVNLLEYNRALPSNAEPITLLVINDYPMGFDSRSTALLANILKNGGRCGVYSLVLHNNQMSPSSYDDVETLIQTIDPYCERVELTGQGIELMPYGLSVAVDSVTMTPERIDEFSRDYEKAYSEAQNRGLAFADVADKELFGGDASDELSIPIGVADGGSVASISFGRGSSHHALIAGATGSGKSTLLHTLIMSAITRYAPDQLQLYLMDFKSGTEFKVYDKRHLPHVRLLALDAMQEFGESILESLVEEMGERSRRFKDVGASKLADYLKLSDESMPRVLVIMDEFQVLFNDRTNRKVANHCAELTKKIVTEGRSYGIHLIMATQSMRDLVNLSLSSGTIEQMRIRVGLKCGERDCTSLFGDRCANDAFKGMLGPRGTAILNQEFTQEDNTRLRVSYCSPEYQREQLDRISDALVDTPCERRTFEGFRTPELLEWRNLIQEKCVGADVPTVVLGEPIKVAPPLTLRFDRRRRHNTIICGSDARRADSIANLYLLESALCPDVQVYCVDGEHLLGEGLTDGFYESLAAHFTNVRIIDTGADIVRMVEELYGLFERRRRAAEKGSVVVLIKSLQYLDLVCSMMRGERIDRSEYLEPEPELEPEPVPEATTTAGESADDAEGDAFDFGLSALKARRSARASARSGAGAGSMRSGSDKGIGLSNQFIRLISDGGSCGIHFVVTAIDWTTVKENMFLNGNLLAKCPDRVVFSLSDSDCSRLVDDVSVEGLPENTVVYSDSARVTCQVKPFAFPRVSELEQWLEGEER